jgi:hypothetical protein
VKRASAVNQKHRPFVEIASVFGQYGDRLLQGLTQVSDVQRQTIAPRSDERFEFIELLIRYLLNQLFEILSGLYDSESPELIEIEIDRSTHKVEQAIEIRHHYVNHP